MDVKRKAQRPILQNVEHEFCLRKNGFVKIPFFDVGELMQLTHLCQQLNGGFDSSFTTTIWSKDAIYRKDVYRELKKIYAAPLQRFFNNCKTVMGTILTKYPEPNSALDIHQDWSFTDEESYTAVNIWVPLVDVTSENGALYFLPYSHLFNVPFRGRHVSPQFNEVKDKIWKHGEPCRVKAGEALVFDVKMVHYSNPNTTKEIRTAVSMVAIPEEAAITHYINYNPEQNTITKMEVDEFFYNNFSHDDVIPKSINAKEFNFKRNQISPEAFAEEYERIRFVAQKL